MFLVPKGRRWTACLQFARIELYDRIRCHRYYNIALLFLVASDRMYLGKFADIPVRIHWTFWVLLLFYVFSVGIASGAGAAFSATVFMVGVFASVLLHEFGHAFAAKKFGIRTVDITLLPIGGMARLEKLPRRPKQELWIAFAGPLVNLVIVACLLPFILLGIGVGEGAPRLDFFGADLLAQLMVANLVLFAFNLLPAFPMDGGRILRSLLAMRTSHLRATQIAARVGRWMALVFAIWALTPWGPLSLLLVAGFVLVAGTTELVSVQLREMGRGAAGGEEPQPESERPTFQNDPFGHQVNPGQPFPQADGHGDASNDDVIDADGFRRL